MTKTAVALWIGIPAGLSALCLTLMPWSHGVFYVFGILVVWIIVLAIYLFGKAVEVLGAEKTKEIVDQVVEQAVEQAVGYGIKRAVRHIRKKRQ
jgi:hypothetical protein